MSSLLYSMAIFILALGPFSLAIINYGVTFTFAAITIQQLFDKEDPETENSENFEDDTHEDGQNETIDKNESDKQDAKEKDTESNESDAKESETVSEESDLNENRIYSIFKNLREKFSRIGEET